MSMCWDLYRLGNNAGNARKAFNKKTFSIQNSQPFMVTVLKTRVFDVSWFPSLALLFQVILPWPYFFRLSFYGPTFSGYPSWPYFFRPRNLLGFPTSILDRFCINCDPSCFLSQPDGKSTILDARVILNCQIPPSRLYDVTSKTCFKRSMTHLCFTVALHYILTSFHIVFCK